VISIFSTQNDAAAASVPGIYLYLYTPITDKAMM